MEHGPAIGTYAGYAVIVLFLLFLAAAVIRTLMLPVALVVLPLLRGRHGSGGAASSTTRGSSLDVAGTTEDAADAP